MMARCPLHARAVAGAVVIEVDPATAEDLARGVVDTDATMTLIWAATQARVQLGLVPDPVNVPWLRLAPETPAPDCLGEERSGAGQTPAAGAPTPSPAAGPTTGRPA